MDPPNDQSSEPPTAPDIMIRQGVMEKFGALDACIQGILGNLFTQSQALQPLLTLLGKGGSHTQLLPPNPFELQMNIWGLPCPHFESSLGPSLGSDASTSTSTDDLPVEVSAALPSVPSYLVSKVCSGKFVDVIRRQEHHNTMQKK